MREYVQQLLQAIDADNVSSVKSIIEKIDGALTDPVDEVSCSHEDVVVVLL